MKYKHLEIIKHLSQLGQQNVKGLKVNVMLEILKIYLELLTISKKN